MKKLVRENLGFTRGGERSTASKLGVGTVALAKEWLESNQEIENNWSTNYNDKLNYKFKISPDKKIRITGISPAALRRKEVPTEVMELVDDRMKFMVATENAYSGDYSGPYVKYAEEAVENGYVPPSSTIIGNLSSIANVLGKDTLLDLMIKRWGDTIPRQITQELQSIYKGNSILKQHFNNPEFDLEDKLVDRPEDVIWADRKKALDMFMDAGYVDITTPIKQKRKTIYVEGDVKKWNLTTGGRLRFDHGTTSYYANDYTTFEEMARIAIDADQEMLERIRKIRKRDAN